MIRAFCWLTAALFAACGAPLLALSLGYRGALPLPHMPAPLLQIAGIAVGSLWLLVGAGCALVAAALAPSDPTGWPAPRSPLRAR